MFLDDRPQPLCPTAPIARGCRAVVTIPAKNEAATLYRCLDAFAAQQGVDGSPLPAGCFEILLLLNNCTDSTVMLARGWQTAHPAITFHVEERILPGIHAHVGTARKLLMDAACNRLDTTDDALTAILTTDADSVVAPDWIAQNLRALERGADVVGGAIHLLPEDLAALSQGLRHCYEQDRLYASLIAELEDLLDPRPGDRCPRHLDHFGSSLACTPRAYRLVGGMPAVTPLEDEAFIGCARNAGLTLRHEPAVKVYTSARLHGRAEIGLARQFECWSRLPSPEAHQVDSANVLEYRFSFLRKLRRIYALRDSRDLYLPTAWWRDTVDEALVNQPTCPAFLSAIFFETLIAESFERDCREGRREPIAQAIHGLQHKLAGIAARQIPEGEELAQPRSALLQ